MTDDIYRVLNRINEIKKRFGLKRHNPFNSQINAHKEESFNNILTKSLDEKSNRIKKISVYNVEKYENIKTGNKYTGNEIGRPADNPFKPEENINAGVKHFKGLLDTFNGDYKKSLSAYNAGKAALLKYNGVSDYKETLDYIEKAIKDYIVNK